MVTEVKVRKALEGVMDPELHKSLIELGMVRQVRIEDGRVEKLAKTPRTHPRTHAWTHPSPSWSPDGKWIACSSH